MSEQILEHAGPGSGPIKVDKARGILYGVKILGTQSKNGRRYPVGTLKKAIPLYENAKVNIDHPDAKSIQPRSYTDRLGSICKGYNTYCSGINDPYVNTVASNPLESWENLEKAENLFANMLDPATKEPVLIEPDTVLVMPQKRGIAYSLFNGVAQASRTLSENVTLASIPNPYSRYNVISSRIAYKRLLDSGVTTTNAAGYWYLGNFQKAFAYMENWPITVTQSPLGSEADFTQDIVVRFKASERGTPAVLNPRYVVKCTS